MKYFLKKTEQDRKREVQELLRKQHAKQMDICSRIIAGQKKTKQNTKRRRYCESDSSDYDAESIEDNHRNDDDDDQSKIEEKLKKKKINKKKNRHHDTHKIMNLVNLSI